MEEKKILGIKIKDFSSNIEIEEMLEQIVKKDDSRFKIYTPNPEMLVKADKDITFKAVLNNADINICDGFGLSLLYRIQRYPGVDLMWLLCRLAEENNQKIFLLGTGDEKVLQSTKEMLLKKFPNLIISDMDKGSIIREIVDKDDSSMVFNEHYDEMVVKKIIESEASMLFVAFGMSKQEKWIDTYFNKMPNIKIAIGVGGAFDYISGNIKRAPIMWRKLGLEWLYRLWQQPSRLIRIYNATIVFIYISLKNKFISK